MRTTLQASHPRFRLLRACLLAFVVLAVVIPGVAPAAPEPAPVATRWEFSFENGPMRLVWIDTGEGPRAYFYLTYRITNYWGSDLLFAPDVQLVTDTGEVQRSGHDVSADVTQQVLDMLDNPLIESQINILSTVLEGPEHARDGVAIWPAKDLDVDEVTVYFGGLSGEQETYVVGRETDNPTRYRLRKTLMLRYSTPGEIANRGSRPLELAEKRWVMR
ncbi:MAG: hypothetical protein KC996_02905 [Phycisphaerales bacterium]|nr:hypothetical protein [Phycisphaerales bacterium]